MPTGANNMGVTNYIATVVEILSPNQTKFQHGEGRNKILFLARERQSQFSLRV